MSILDQIDTDIDNEEGYAFSLEMLAYHADKIPPGWSSLYEQMIRSLKAIECPKRMRYRLLPPEVDMGVLTINWHNDERSLPDSVVRGILRKMEHRSQFTCEICGRSAIYESKHFSTHVLCPRCSAQRESRSSVHLWLKRLKNRVSMSMMDPVIALKSLPMCLREMISTDSIRKLQISYKTDAIEYVTASDIQALQEELEVVQEYLSTVCAISESG